MAEGGGAQGAAVALMGGRDGLFGGLEIGRSNDNNLLTMILL